MTHLQIYVKDACPSCARSRSLASEIASEYNQVSVEIIEIETLPPEHWPEALFATPTWMLNGRRFCLGTPDPRRLRREIEAVSSQSSPASSPKGSL